MKPSEQEITQEIEKLKQIRSNTPPTAKVTFDDHYVSETVCSLINAQIKALEQRWSGDYVLDNISPYAIYEEYAGYIYAPGNACELMEEAGSWLDGIWESPPSKIWKEKIGE